MRKVSNTAMATLIVVALFWGNCFSCPQVLLTSKSHQTAHGCCHRTKQTTEDCQTQVLRHFVKADVGSRPPATVMVAGVVIPEFTVGVPQRPDWASFIPVGHAPPDLLSLHSSFRI
jgi:hypothetical protein